MKKPKKFNFKAYITSVLRRASYRWKPRTEAMNKVKIARNQYKCEGCREVFGRKDVAVDHRKPVVDPIEGFINWDIFIQRLFVEADGYQVLCRDKCHYNKTQAEKEIRKRFKKKKEK